MGNSTSFPAETAGPPRSTVTCCRQSYRVIYASAIAVMVINLVFTPLLFGVSIVSPWCFPGAVIMMLTISGYIFTQSKNLGSRMNSNLNNSQLAFSIIVAIFAIVGGSLEFQGYTANALCSSYAYAVNRNMSGYYSYYGSSTYSSANAASCVVTYAYAYTYGLATYDQYLQMLSFYYGVIVSGVNFIFITVQVILFSITCVQVWKEASRQANGTDLENGVRNIVVKDGAQDSHGSPARGTIQSTAQYSPAQSTPLQYIPAQPSQYNPAQTTPSQYNPAPSQYSPSPSQYNPAQPTPSQMPTSPSYGQPMYPPVYTPDPISMPVDAWSKSDVCKWLEQEQLETLSAPFRTNSIDGLAMSSLTQGELQQMNLPIGRVKKFLSARERLLSRKVHPTQ